MVKNPSSWNDKLSRLRKKASKLAERHGLTEGYRSGLELKLALEMREQGIEFQFETLKIKWTPLPIEHTYNPDFIITTNAGKTLIVESKGRFMPDDMQKHLAIKQQRPDIEVLFVFQNAQKWHRAAKTRSYAKWCEENGFRYCNFRDFSQVIKEWINE